MYRDPDTRDPSLRAEGLPAAVKGFVEIDVTTALMHNGTGVRIQQGLGSLPR